MKRFIKLFSIATLSAITLFLIVVDPTILKNVLIDLFNPSNDTEKEHVVNLLDAYYMSKFKFAFIVPGGLAMVLVFWFDAIHLKISKLLSEIGDFILWIFYRRKVFLLSILLFSVGIVFIIMRHIGVDESYSYIYYIEKNPLVCLGSYSAANNHILHSFLSSIVQKMGLGVNVSLRLVPLLSFVFLINLLFKTFTKETIRKSNWYLVCLFAVSLYPIYYAVTGRGYMLQFLLYFITLAHIYIKYEKDQKPDLILISVLMALGFFTIPSMIYPFIGLCLFFLFTKPFGFVFKFGLLTTVLVLLAYSPILMTTGFQFDGANANLVKKPITKILEMYPNYIFNFILNYAPLVFGTLVLCIQSFTKKVFSNRWLHLHLVSVLVVFLLPLVDLRFPPQRTMIFLYASFILVLGASINKEKINNVLLVGLIAISVLHTIIFIPRLNYFDSDLVNLEERLESKIFDNLVVHSGPKTFIQLYTRQKKEAVKFDFIPFKNRLENLNNLERNSIVVSTKNYPHLLENEHLKLVDSTNYYFLFRSE